jgi:hypothetical protein
MDHGIGACPAKPACAPIISCDMGVCMMPCNMDDCA